MAIFFFQFIHSDLLSLHPPSLTHTNPQRHPKVRGTHPAGCKKRLIDRSEDVFVECHVHVISVAVLVAVF